MFDLFLAELRRRWIEFSRYPLEAVGGIFIITAIFYGLFLSARYIAGPGLKLGDRVDSIVIGYVLWTLVLFIITDVAGNLQLEAQTGTLEQLFLSRYAAIRVFLTRTLANLSLQMLLLLVILFIIMGLTGSRLHFPILLVLPFITVLMGAYGIAFAIGSLALLFKRIQQLIGIFQFGLLFLLSTPIESWDGSLQIVGQLLPMAGGAGLLRDLMARGESLNYTKLVIAAVNGVVYFALGLLLFYLAERVAKRRGMLSGY